MTFYEYLTKLLKFSNQNPEAGKLEVVFHDTDGLTSVDVDVSVDNTCNDGEQVVRVNMIEVE